VRLSALRASRHLPPGRFLILISVRDWVDPRVIVRLQELGKLKKFNDLIRNWTRDLPTCSIVPQLRYRVPPQVSDSVPNEKPRIWSDKCRYTSRWGDGWLWRNGGRLISRGKPNKLAEKPASVLVCPLWNSHKVTLHWTWKFAARNHSCVKKNINFMLLGYIYWFKYFGEYLRDAESGHFCRSVSIWHPTDIPNENILSPIFTLS
jgi:hypothetical protein